MEIDLLSFHFNQNPDLSNPRFLVTRNVSNQFSFPSDSASCNFIPFLELIILFPVGLRNQYYIAFLKFPIFFFFLLRSLDAGKESQENLSRGVFFRSLALLYPTPTPSGLVHSLPVSLTFLRIEKQKNFE